MPDLTPAELDAIEAQVSDAIEHADRCEQFYDASEPCDGLQGCGRCLTLAAKNVRAVIEPPLRAALAREGE